jgi:lipoprotein-anchoring transpeptidase ErfK/SrfK
MLRFFRLALIAGTAFAATATAAVAEIDPLTRQPLVNYVDPAKAQATAIPREIVSFSGTYRPGTIVINTSERRLYYVLPDGKAVRYGVGVGRPGFEWGGSQTITRKAEWPTWTPPAQMLKRRPDLPRFMPGGPENPMGARAMYLGSTLYRIHGSNEPETIGQAVSSGCIRMLNEDVIDLYERAKVGTRVVVAR